jgi:hypothetical protein
MPSSKIQSPYTHGKQSTPSPKSAMTRTAPTGRPASAARVPAAKPSTPSVRAQSPVAKQVRETSGPAHKASSGSSKVKPAVSRATGANAPPVPTKRTTPWTIEAAGRIASVTAKKGDGTVKKGSLAAGAMSRAMKNERSGKVEK